MPGLIGKQPPPRLQRQASELLSRALRRWPVAAAVQSTNSMVESPSIVGASCFHGPKPGFHGRAAVRPRAMWHATSTIRGTRKPIVSMTACRPALFRIIASVPLTNTTQFHFLLNLE